MLTDAGRSGGTMTARDKARYVIVPVGLAGMPVGAYNAATGYPLIGAWGAVIRSFPQIGRIEARG